jgi:hypothetical protein
MSIAESLSLLCLYVSRTLLVTFSQPHVNFGARVGNANCRNHPTYAIILVRGLRWV